MEPCSKRASRPRPCAQLIQDAGLRRVVTAWSEPDTFVAGAEGTEILEGAGVTTIALPEYANAAQTPNRHLLCPPPEQGDLWRSARGRGPFLQRAITTEPRAAARHRRYF
ncbi:hypothetical protein [Streptomyces anulatus]|uniref:hypothetical protein n=1 Tax=Streptomyces anulatus TaxID=1892 RepID=UPI0035577E41